MAKIDLGKVAVTAAGNWNANTSYEALTMVVNVAATGGDGCGYISLKNNIGVRPGTNPAVWMIATQAGQSIYDLAVARGYEGTEDEFVAEYNAAVQAALDAASAARAAEREIEEAETARAGAEEARERAEAARASAEGEREAAESARESAEEARETAEAARETAEQGRATTFARQSAQMAAALETSDAATSAANTAAATANAAAGYARETAEEAAGHAEEAAAATAQMNAGLVGLKVEDGELILVQNAETGTVTDASMDDDGMVTLTFEV